jgi:hypothetical protein
MPGADFCTTPTTSLDIPNTQMKTPAEILKTLKVELKGLKNRTSPTATLQAFVATPNQLGSRCRKHPHLFAHRCFHCIKSLDFRNMKRSSCGTMGHKSDTFHKCTNFETEHIHMPFAYAQAPRFEDTLIEFTDDDRRIKKTINK